MVTIHGGVLLRAVCLAKLTSRWHAFGQEAWYQVRPLSLSGRNVAGTCDYRTRPSTDSKGTFGGDHWLQRSKAKEG